MVITWNTKKTETGFEGIVSTVEYQKPSKVLKRITNCRSRNIAKRHAQKWSRYFKQTA